MMKVAHIKHGVKVVNSKLRTVMIRWNANKVAEGDLLVSKHMLTKRGWNPKRA
jgi:hypothetical protein